MDGHSIAPLEISPQVRLQIRKWIFQAATDLAGYADFARRTRFRLVPGVW